MQEIRKEWLDPSMTGNPDLPSAIHTACSLASRAKKLFFSLSLFAYTPSRSAAARAPVNRKELSVVFRPLTHRLKIAMR